MKYFLVGYLIFMGFGLFALYSSEAEPKYTKPYISKDLYLHGEVNDGMAFAVGNAINEYNEEGVDEIVLHITSPGGSVYAGLQIYDYMRGSKAKISTVCEGYCMSMAAYLLSLGDKRSSMAHASIMFHQVATTMDGNLPSLRNDMKEAERLQDSINDLLSKRTKISPEELSKIESYDHYMSPQEAKELGLIDNIIGE